jgi:hypothetical protein
MSSKDYHINPLTGRSIKTSGVTYKKLMEKDEKITTIQASIKSKKAQSDLNEKKEAVNKLKAVIKRSTTKKTDPPKKFGFEDLPGDVKELISGKIQKQKKRKEMLKDLRNLFEYTNNNTVEKGLKHFKKLKDDELYNALYKTNDVKNYIEKNYMDSFLNRLPEITILAGMLLKNKLKYEDLELIKKNNPLLGVEVDKFITYYKQNSDNKWYSIFNSYFQGSEDEQYVFFDLDKNKFWRIRLNEQLRKKFIKNKIIYEFGGEDFNWILNDHNKMTVKKAPKLMLDKHLIDGKLSFNWNEFWSNKK